MSSIAKYSENIEPYVRETEWNLIEKLQEILRHERLHFNFYLQASMVVKGFERLYLKPLFEKEMTSELEHIRKFGDKIFAMGVIPGTETFEFCITNKSNSNDLLLKAIEIEKEVLKLYHETYPLAEEYAKLFRDKSVVLLLEENIEHTTEDVEEMEKLLKV